MCRRTDQRLDVMEQRLQIVRCNQEIIYSQRDEPLLEFLDVPGRAEPGNAGVSSMEYSRSP
jgi:hypothetical protein